MQTRLKNPQKEKLGCPNANVTRRVNRHGGIAVPKTCFHGRQSGQKGWGGEGEGGRRLGVGGKWGVCVFDKEYP